ncbi:hypothetical protein R5R35_008227 [Gryllus longicercus]|uniref:Uncharacterized protein n=1 Tax=Gryllus longicercus TaxID=2509291 RepID=A0AAN9VV74_9ORTH
MPAPPLRLRHLLPLPLPVCLLLGVALLCPLGSSAFAADGPQQMYPGLYPGVSADEYEAMRNSLRELEADALRRALLRDLQEQAMEEAAAVAAAAAAAARSSSSSREEPLPLPAGAGPGPMPAERLPVPLPLVRAAYGGAGPDLSKEEPPVKKIKGYGMSLCLFKICNMGRKRTNRS